MVELPQLTNHLFNSLTLNMSKLHPRNVICQSKLWVAPFKGLLYVYVAIIFQQCSVGLEEVRSCVED